MGRKFEEIFEECLSALLEGRRSVEESLSLYPSLANELEPLLRAAAEIAPAFDFRPPDAVQEEARQRFLTAARLRRQRALAAAPPAPAPWWQWAPLAAGATAALGVLALLGATLMNEEGGGFSDRVTVRLATPAPSPSPATLGAPLAQARVQLEALETAVLQGQPVEPTVIRELRDANRQIAARLDDLSTVRGRDLAAARSQASRQYCLLSEIREQVPPAQAADVAETLAATEEVLERLGVLVPESSSTPQAIPTPSPSPGATSAAQASPQPTATPSASFCAATTPAPSATPTPQQSPAAAPTPSPSQP